MKQLKLSGFDLGVIIAFAAVAVLGAAAWWYLSGELQQAQSDVAAAKSNFDKYSTKYNIVVSESNGKTLQTNIDLLKAHLDPLIQGKLLPKENTLHSIEKEDPVAWKHDLDTDVHDLNAKAKLASVALPHNFYFGFSRYMSQSPSDEQTAVLSKQLVGVKELATILIDTPVKSIQTIGRTYEEDPHASRASASAPTTESDHVGGYSLNAPGNAYTAYPFEVDFETTPENLRTVLTKLIQSPYLFVVRTLNVQNSDPNSPQIGDLDKLAGTPTPSAIETSPGEVAATVSTKGPQFLFGNATLKIKARVDMIEWKADLSEAPPAPAHGAPHSTPPAPRRP